MRIACVYMKRPHTYFVVEQLTSHFKLIFSRDFEKIRSIFAMLHVYFQRKSYPHALFFSLSIQFWSACKFVNIRNDIIESDVICSF